MQGTPTRLLANLAIDVALYRGAGRALLMRSGSRLEDLPPYVLSWLGPIDSVEETVFCEATKLMGISTAAVMYDLLTQEYCLMEPH